MHRLVIEIFFVRIYRISLFQLEKKRTEGLDFIVIILQKVCQPLQNVFESFKFCK